MRIFANHAHLLPPEVRPGASREDLLRLMDVCGIARAVCFAPFEEMLGDSDLGDANLWLAEEIEGFEELVGFGVLHPLRPESLRELPRLRDLGLRGVKLHPAIQRFEVTDPRAMEFYAAASELGLPLNFHTGVHGSPLREGDLLKFDDITWAVPGACMVLEHVGTLPFYYQALGVIANGNYGETRVYAGITTVLNPEVRMWYLGEERLEEIARRLGAEVMIYGLDFPYNSRRVIRRELEVLRGLDLGPGGQEALLGGNLARLIGEGPESE